MATQDPRTQLYLISPPQIDERDFIPQLEAALSTGKVAAFQLRLKGANDKEIVAVAKQCLSYCQHNQVPFIINDRVDLVSEAGADGVHIGYEDGGSESGKVKAIRKQLGKEATIGVSCYDSPDLAMQAAEEGADYVSFGAFYTSPTKESRGNPDLALLEWWTTYTTIPCVAIGGINAKNCQEVAKAGADFIAVISAIWSHEKGAAFAIEELVGRLSPKIS